MGDRRQARAPPSRAPFPDSLLCTPAAVAPEPGSANASMLLETTQELVLDTPGPASRVSSTGHAATGTQAGPRPREAVRGPRARPDPSVLAVAGPGRSARLPAAKLEHSHGRGCVCGDDLSRCWQRCGPSQQRGAPAGLVGAWRRCRWLCAARVRVRVWVRVCDTMVAGRPTQARMAGLVERETEEGFQDVSFLASS